MGKRLPHKHKAKKPKVEEVKEAEEAEGSEDELFGEEIDADMEELE